MGDTPEREKRVYPLGNEEDVGKVALMGSMIEPFKE